MGRRTQNAVKEVLPSLDTTKLGWLTRWRTTGDCKNLKVTSTLWWWTTLSLFPDLHRAITDTHRDYFFLSRLQICTNEFIKPLTLSLPLASPRRRR